jgi:hypothetical protein
MYKASIIEQAKKNDSTVICHATLDIPDNAVCGGFYINDSTIPLRLATATNCIEFVPPIQKEV